MAVLAVPRLSETRATFSHSPPVDASYFAWYTTFPPMIVYATFAVRISSSGTFVMSFVSTVMSASLPTVSEPLMSSSNAANAF